jgi:AraC family transcriptional regulator
MLRNPLPEHSLRRALDYIDANLDSPLAWNDMARAVGMSRFDFGRRFKRSTGRTPHQYIVDRRIAEARHMLASTDRPICEIALDVGCCCQSHLTTLFRKHLGITPGAFRARMPGQTSYPSQETTP